MIKLTHEQVKQKLTIDRYWLTYQKLTGEKDKSNFYEYIRDTYVWEALCFLTLFDEIVVDTVTTKLFAKQAAERFELLGIDRLVFQLELIFQIDLEASKRFLYHIPYEGIRSFNKRVITLPKYREFLLDIVDNNRSREQLDEQKFIKDVLGIDDEAGMLVLKEYLEKPNSERVSSFTDLSIVLKMRRAELNELASKLRGITTVSV